MSKSKASMIAAHLNASGEHPSHHRRIAHEIADNLHVGLYWLGSASSRDSLDIAEVYAMRHIGRMVQGSWSRKIGEIVRGHDGIWRA